MGTPEARAVTYYTIEISGKPVCVVGSDFWAPDTWVDLLQGLGWWDGEAELEGRPATAAEIAVAKAGPQVPRSPGIVGETVLVRLPQPSVRH